MLRSGSKVLIDFGKYESWYRRNYGTLPIRFENPAMQAEVFLFDPVTQLAFLTVIDTVEGMGEVQKITEMPVSCLTEVF